MYVPDAYTLDGIPLICSSHTGSKYLSRRYTKTDWEFTKVIGVEELTFQSFFDDLELFIVQCPSEYHAQSQRWHSRLAEIIAPQMGIPGYSDKIARLKIIPLRDGQWVSAVSGTIFFPSTKDQMPVPTGIHVMEVDPMAQDDDNRLRLFQLLWVKPFETSAICQIIVDRHASLNSPATLSRDDLQAHVAFLFDSKWKNPGVVDLWVATDSGKYQRASKVYILNKNRHTRNNQLEVNGDKFPVLHQSYIDAAPTDTHSWILWLKRNLDLWEVPRLVSSGTDDFELSIDMKSIIQNWPSRRLLTLWRDNWRIYARWLEKNDSADESLTWKVSKKKLRDTIMSTEVQCRYGVQRPLNQTILLPLGMEWDKNLNLPLLNLPDPESQAWTFLEHLGVTVRLDLRFYLACLDSIKGTKASTEQIRLIYSEIQAQCDSDLERTK